MRALLTVMVLSSTAGVVDAQEPDPVDLVATERLTGAPFSRIRGLQELSDGRILVADQTEEGLYRIDFERQTREKLGRNGQGPGEYSAPSGLRRFVADSVIMIDIGNGRLPVVAPDGTIGRTIPLFGEGVTIPTGTDVSGNRYWDHVSGVRLAKRGDPTIDQAAIVRYDPATGKGDSIAYLTVPGGPNPNALPAWDEWDVGPNGWVAIVRNQEEYRVDWVAPDGTVRRGDPVAGYRPLRVTNADREALSERRRGGAVFGGGGGGRPPPLDVPDRFPPAMAVWVTWDARAVVQRHQHVDEERILLDVFDRSGERVARYRLPEGRTVIEIGRSGLFAYHEDELGFQWVELYPLP